MCDSTYYGQHSVYWCGAWAFLLRAEVEAGPNWGDLKEVESA